MDHRSLTGGLRRLRDDFGQHVGFGKSLGADVERGGCPIRRSVGARQQRHYQSAEEYGR